MPIYKVRDNKMGKVVTFKWNGEKPPTDTDMEEVFSDSRAMPSPSTATPALQLPSSSSPGASLGEIDPSLMGGPPPKGILPVAGSLLGGGATLALTGNPVASYMANVGGAGLGSVAEDYLYGTPKEETQKNALSSSIFAGVFPGVGGAVERAITPGAKAVTAEARSALEYARANNLPIDVSEINPSWVTQLFSGDIFAAGRYKTRQYAKSANEYLMGVRSKILETLTGAPETSNIPISAVQAKVRPALKASTRQAYEEPLRIVKEAFGDSEPIVRLENTRRTAGSLLQDVRVQNAKKARGAVASPREWTEDFLRKSEKQGGLTFNEIHQAQSQINRVFYGATNEGGAPLLASLADDLVKWDAEVGKRLNESYDLARKSAKSEFLFDTVYNTIRAATKVDRETGAEMLNGAILRAKLQTPMKKAGWRTPEGEILEKLGKEEGQKVIDDLYSLADYAQYTMKLRGKENLPVLNLADVGVSGAAKALNFAGIPGAIAVPQGSSLAFTVMLTGPGRKGILRNFLMAEGHPTLKLGTRLGLQYGAEQLK